MSFFYPFLFLAIIVAAPHPSHATNYSIAAIVNDTVISNVDVEERTKLVLATTGLPNNAETRAKIREQVLSSMIDEALKLQEARRYNYSVSGKEREGAIAMLTSQRKIDHPNGVKGKLIEQGVSLESFNKQLEGEILWNKVIRDRIVREVSISDDEVRRAQNQIVNSVQEEVNIASMVLPVTSPEEELRVEQLAKSIANDASDAETFAAIARQLGSQGLRSVRPQWVPEGRLDPSYRRAIAPLKAGQVSAATRTANGYEILLFNGRRERPSAGDSELYLKQVVLPLKENAPKTEVEEMIDIAKIITENPGNCFTPSIAGIDDTESLGIKIDFLRTKLSALSKQIRSMVSELKVSKISRPFPTADGVQMLMVCERIEMPPELPDAKKVKQVLFDEKLALETQKYIRNLRRSAFIDKREG